MLVHRICSKLLQTLRKSYYIVIDHLIMFAEQAEEKNNEKSYKMRE